MKQKLFYAAALFLGMCTVLSSCSNEDPETTLNPAEQEVASKKAHDTAILLCTFGSTYNESLKVYDEIIKEYEEAFDADVYMSFTSRTCIGRAEASTGVARYKLSMWLDAIGEAGYKRVAVQSLHVIPGEEYLSLMNTDIKKTFMIEKYPHIDVLRSPNLLADDEDTKAVAAIIYENYKDKLADPKNVVVLMGHGNPDDNYNANQKYIDIENELQKLAPNKNIFVGTVDYGEMLFWPGEVEDEEAVSDAEVLSHEHCMFTKLHNYAAGNERNIKVYMAPFMSIAGDHSHNDLWGLEGFIEGDEDFEEVELNTNEFSWRERICKMGFTIGNIEDEFEWHPRDLVNINDHGAKEGCTIKALGSYPEIRQIWINHMKALWEDGWQNGMDYQPE